MGAITLSVNHWINHVFFQWSKNLTVKKFLLIWPFFEHHIDSQKGSSKFAEVQKKEFLKMKSTIRIHRIWYFKFYKPDLIILSLFFAPSTFLQIPQNVLRRAQYAFQKKQICLPGLFIGFLLRPFLSWSKFSTHVFMSCLTPRSVRR